MILLDQIFHAYQNFEAAYSRPWPREIVSSSMESRGAAALSSFLQRDDVPAAIKDGLGTIQEHVVITGNFDGTHIVLEIMYPSKTRAALSRKRHGTYLKLFCQMVFLCNHFQRRNHVHVVLALFDVPRQTVSEREMLQHDCSDGISLGPEHINAGVTFLAEPKIALVYRREDWQKVLMHELLHLYNFDFYVPASDEREAQMAQRYHVQPHQGKLGMNEAYNEAITVLFYIALRVLRRSAKRLPISEFRHRVKWHRLDLTKRFCRTAAWIHHVCRDKSRDAILKERTHVFAYYIAKASLFASFEEFSIFCDALPHGGHMANSHVAEFYMLIRQTLEAVHFNKLIDKRPKVRGPYSMRMMYGLSV